MSEPSKPTETVIAGVEPQIVVKRGPGGKFAPGGPGGPGRKGLPPEVREMLEASTVDAARRLIEALDATKIVVHQGKEFGPYVDHAMRTTAAEALFSRLYGKPPQALDVGELPEGGATIGIVFLPTGGKP